MTNRLEIREKRKKRRQKQRLLTVLIIVGGVLIIAAAIMIPSIQSIVNPAGDLILPERISRVFVDANTAGIPDAPVTLSIYSDFGCGYCAQFALTTGQKIYQEYVATGLIQLDYHSVGSLLGHPNSVKTAEAAYCAGDQNMFWDYHDLLYANQRELFASMTQKIDRKLIAYADTLGLDVDQFTDCYTNNTFEQKIADDYSEALLVNINSTPSFMLNDKFLLGNIPYEEFKSEIDIALAKAGL